MPGIRSLFRSVRFGGDRFRSGRSGAVVLLFHRVSGRSRLSLEPDTAVSLSTFTTIIKLISEHREPVPLSELLHRVQRRQSVDRCVSVTFDDGFADNLHDALPVLDQFNVPATVFVTSGFVSGEVSPTEYRLAQIVATAPALKLEIEGDQMSWITNTDHEKSECYKDIQQRLKFSSETCRVHSLDSLAHQTEVVEVPQQFALMSPGEMRELDRSPLITIGAHTRSHLVLPSVSPAEAMDDIRRGKYWLESQLDHPVNQFAYPYGAYDLTIQKQVRQLGFQLAVTTQAEQIPRVCDPFAIPRIEVKEEGTANLVANLMGSR